MKLKIKGKTKKALTASARANYEQKLKGNKANMCVGNFLHFYMHYIRNGRSVGLDQDWLNFLARGPNSEVEIVCGPHNSDLLTLHFGSVSNFFDLS